MFSELRHHPRFTFQMKTAHGLPSHISQEWSGKNNYQREKMIVQKMLESNCLSPLFTLTQPMNLTSTQMNLNIYFDRSREVELLK